MPGTPETIAATPRVPSAVPALRPSWRPLAIAALALAAGGAGALIYARLSHEPGRADDGPRADPAAPTHPDLTVVEPRAAAAAPSGSTKPAAPRTGDPDAPASPAPVAGASAATAGAPSPAPVAPPDAAAEIASAPAAAKSDRRVPGASRPPAAARPSGPPGFITIDSSPVYAVISIDGKSYGETPLVRLELSPGRHVVHAVSPSGATRDVRISIEPGKIAPAARIAW